MTSLHPIMQIQTDLLNGKPNTALKMSRKWMKRDPRNPHFPNLCGLALCALDQHRQAVALFNKAISLDPQFVDAQSNLAQTLISLGLPEKALAVVKRVLQVKPQDEGACYLQAQAQLQMGDVAGAEASAGRAIALNSQKPRTYNLRGIARYRLGKLDAAIADYHAALDLDPNNIETLVNISLPLSRQSQHEQAIAVVRKAVSMAPTHIGAHLRLAACLVENGDLDLGIQVYAKALVLDPANAEALFHLADLKPDQKTANAAHDALKRPGLHASERANLNFALARLSEYDGDPIKTARHLDRANRAMAGLMPYDRDADTALNAAIMQYFSETQAVPDGQAKPPGPIFVLGLPRSGTTLVETMLGLHPTVEPLGELVAAGRFLYPIIENRQPFDSFQATAFRHAYVKALPQISDDTRAYVDKMPDNYRLIGFLKRSFPESRIICLRRDPRDVALSMWRGHFAGTALNYTYDLGAMAHRFNLFARLMAFWHDRFPGQILDVSYENLVAAPQREGPRIARYCDLDWQPQMASPDRSDAPVLTASAAQIRQPVHQRSVGKWHQYTDVLAPFLDELDLQLWPELG